MEQQLQLVHLLVQLVKFGKSRLKLELRQMPWPTKIELLLEYGPTLVLSVSHLD